MGWAAQNRLLSLDSTKSSICQAGLIGEILPGVESGTFEVNREEHFWGNYLLECYAC
ncbi:hypothetical protein BDA96_06G062200 [Sorghum bicolor]|uniref:Uncharacterized protein n=1 Tax=Sorghum bicolor TaxID=4558 RepID=A0A921QNT9_SORBI|nr:hypothetical protein BDA96_06G062200 [Sorghum bicolor]